MTTAGCNSFAGLATNRFFLGMAEASINPGFVMLMSIWYTSVGSILFYARCGNDVWRVRIYILAILFNADHSSLLAYAIGHIHSDLQQWQYIFLIFGAISILCGIYALICLPDLPSTANFLSVRERTVAVHRTAANRQGVKNKQFKWYQVKQAALVSSSRLFRICLALVPFLDVQYV
jgi:MFS family permease